MSRIVTVTDWDSKLPTGDWSGPAPLPLFPPLFDKQQDATELGKAFRDCHILANASREQHQDLKVWVEEAVPDEMKWLIQGLDFYHPEIGLQFFSLNSAHLDRSIDLDIHKRHPEVLAPEWDSRLDISRATFLKKLNELGCVSALISDEEALDRGILVLKGYERPYAMMHSDIYPGTSNNEMMLWRYLTLPKFIRMLQTNEIWFSRPKYFNDPHEFSTDRSTQQSLIEWRLNSFCRAYNRAVKSSRTRYLGVAATLTDGLAISGDGVIKEQSVKFSDLSPILLSSIRNDLKRWQESFGISCWRYSEHDSVAMWNQYASIEEGIAITANLEKLRFALRKYGDIRLALVDYRDMSTDSTQPMKGIPLQFKDIRFAAEDEARFYFSMPLHSEQPGIGIKVKLAEVVDAIYLSPNANQWFKDIVSNLVSRYHLNVNIVDSPLGRIPSKF